MSWFLAVLKKYAVFTGRARRKEYWMFMLINILFSIVAVVIDYALGTIDKDSGYGAISGLYSLALILPTLAVTVRRLHDLGKSGWWYFIILIPILGGIWLFVLMVTEGQAFHNQYGPDPKAVVPA